MLQIESDTWYHMVQQVSPIKRSSQTSVALGHPGPMVCFWMVERRSAQSGRGLTAGDHNKLTISISKIKICWTFPQSIPEYTQVFSFIASCASVVSQLGSGAYGSVGGPQFCNHTFGIPVNHIVEIRPSVITWKFFQENPRWRHMMSFAVTESAAHWLKAVFLRWSQCDVARGTLASEWRPGYSDL